MDQIRPFPPTDLIDRAEEEETIRLAPAVELKDWVIKNFLTLGGALHNPDHDHISELLHDDETFLAFAWANENVQRLVEVAKQAPFVSEKNIAACCGTCLIN